MVARTRNRTRRHFNQIYGGTVKMRPALPAQIVRTARRLIYRILGYNRWLKDFLAACKRIRQLAQSG